MSTLELPAVPAEGACQGSVTTATVITGPTDNSLREVPGFQAGHITDVATVMNAEQQRMLTFTDLEYRMTRADVGRLRKVPY